jgi:hypothetical protein
VVAKARRWGVKITRLDVVAPFVPLLIATRLRAPTAGQATVDILEACECFAFRVYAWGEWRSHTGQGALHRLANQRYAGTLDDVGLLDQLRGLLHWYHAEHAFAAELQEQALDKDNDWYGWSALRYFLYEWEEKCARGASVPLSWDQVSKEDLAKTVEHILPQSPSGAYWQQHFNAAERRRYTHDIGNLVLTQYNPSLSNKGFVEKKGHTGSGKRDYANSNIVSERALASLGQWDAATLRARRTQIVAWAKQRWGVAPSSAASPPPHADDDESVD